MDSFDPHQETANAPLIINPSAVRKAKALIEMEEDKDLLLRVFVTGGGCSGFQYGFLFDKKQNEDDICIVREGMRFVVDSLSVQYLAGAEVTYQEGLEGARFVINNPNAKTTCGCGSSFSV